MARALMVMGLAGGCADDVAMGPEETGSSGEVEDGTAEGTGDSGDSASEPACGNGIVEAGEVCDEGGPTGTCDVDCTPVTCGDGVVNETAGEACDEGGATATCDADCTLAGCGDGVVNETAGEACDEGGATATCRFDCAWSLCGDGIVNPLAGEACDDGGETATCNAGCTVAACGDGVVNEAAGEQCDGGGASATCLADCSWSACGDGIVNPLAGEACDEGGATVTCDVDCTPVACGDGVANEAAGEQCDGGGKSAACDWDCTVAECGDGIVNALAGEACDTAGRTGACDVDCSLAQCGDGLVNAAAGEACDDAGESAACNVDCSVAECGDGITNATAGEVCDDAGETVACDIDCTTVACGDGVANPTAGEQCDDAGESAACNADCTVAVCGDGDINPTAGEQCDDAGETAACNIDCSIAACGDGYANAAAGEQCDGLDFGGLGCGDVVALAGPLGCMAGCAYDTTECTLPLLQLSFSQVKQFDFSWAAVPDAEYYQVLESASPGEPYVQLGGDIVGQSVSFEMPLHFRWQASYVLRACNAGGCNDSEPVGVVGSLAEAVGYVKASNTGAYDEFGYHVALSGDGSTLAVGAPNEDSNATGVGGNQADNSASGSGAVYVFTRDGLGAWSQQAYVKASNTGTSDEFGYSVALNEDGSTLAVGARGEGSNATGVGGNQADNSASSSGAVYVFTRDGLGAWSQQAYVKASNTGGQDRFGSSVALSGDGSTLAVGAQLEASNATGVGGNQADNSASWSGAVYVFTRDGLGAWSQQVYLKASNTGANDEFGSSVALSGDGSTLAVGARLEDSIATGIGGNQADNSASSSGAVYVFTRDGLGAWSQQAFVKASNTGASDEFGSSVALSGDGSTLAVGARLEDSSATGVGGNQADNSISSSGAVYVFTRDGLGAWSQQAYVKASNTGLGDAFGSSVALSGDGSTLAVGARGEDSNATGVGGNQGNSAWMYSTGAVYVFTRDGLGAWSQQAYVKSSNTGSGDLFGVSVALSGDGSTLAVGANEENGNATGIGGNQVDNSASDSGAVYLY